MAIASERSALAFAQPAPYAVRHFQPERELEAIVTNRAARAHRLRFAHRLAPRREKVDPGGLIDAGGELLPRGREIFLEERELGGTGVGARTHPGDSRPSRLCEKRGQPCELPVDNRTGCPQSPGPARTWPRSRACTYSSRLSQATFNQNVDTSTGLGSRSVHSGVPPPDADRDRVQ